MRSDSRYCLMISGPIGKVNLREFIQTVQFISTDVSKDCVEIELYHDELHPPYFLFATSWLSMESATAFIGSKAFDLLSSAFKTLSSEPGAELNVNLCRKEGIDLKQWRNHHALYN